MAKKPRVSEQLKARGAARANDRCEYCLSPARYATQRLIRSGNTTPPRLGGMTYSKPAAGPWELPVIGAVTAPTAVVIRPDGYVAWVGDQTHLGVDDALTAWFGPPQR